MPASPRTLFWLNTTNADEPFGVASSWTATEGSSTPAATAPTSIDDTEIDTTATVSGSGSASVFNINAGVTVSGSLNTDVAKWTTSAPARRAASPSAPGHPGPCRMQLSVGGADHGQMTISGGGSLTTDADVPGSTSLYDIIFRAPGRSLLPAPGQNGRATPGIRSPWIRGGPFPSPTAARFNRHKRQTTAASSWRTARCRSTVRASRRPEP